VHTTAGGGPHPDDVASLLVGAPDLVAGGIPPEFKVSSQQAGRVDGVG